MKRKLLWLIVIAVLVICFVIYRSRQSSTRLDVDPHAAEEIEKAKRR